MSFYGIFLLGIMLGYVRSKRREKKSNALTHLLYEEERREWGDMRKKHSLPLPSCSGLGAVQVSLPFSGLADGRLPAPFSCAMCTMEQSSVSSLCSSADIHCAIEEEEADAGEPCEALKAKSDNREECVAMLHEAS
ncbi:KCNE4 protein, partial [Amia calva]|nr:KCNE4 protein [Amia calva]